MTSTSAPDPALLDEDLEGQQDAGLLLDETEDWDPSEQSLEEPEPNAEGIFPGVPLS